MITVKQMHGRGCCDNCNRMMDLIMRYEFNDKPNIKPYVKFCLCEDCSNALSKLHIEAIKYDCDVKYDMDEIIRIL